MLSKEETAKLKELLYKLRKECFYDSERQDVDNAVELVLNYEEVMQGEE